jgi:hypothetical protein
MLEKMRQILCRKILKKSSITIKKKCDENENLSLDCGGWRDDAGCWNGAGCEA